MSEMVERVARVLAQQAGQDPDEPRSYLPDESRPMWTVYVRPARAVIEAMREPTEAMVDKAMADDDTGMPLARSYDEVWGSMIDAALDNKKPA